MARTITVTGHRIKAGADTGHELIQETVPEKNYALQDFFRISTTAAVGGKTWTFADLFAAVAPKVRFVHIENHDPTNDLIVTINKAGPTAVMSFDIDANGVFSWRGKLPVADLEAINIVIASDAGTPQYTLCLADTA